MLFRRKSENRNEPAPEPPPEPPRTTEPRAAPSREPGSNGIRSQSFIDASLTIMGDLHSDGDVHLDGRVCGNVSCAQLIVGRDAAVTGAITAEQAVIRGTITGPIRSPVVILQDSARVESDITYTVLAIDDGATFEGAACRSNSPLEEPEAVSPLAELQRIVLSGDPAKTTNGSDASRRDTAAADAGKAAAAPEAATDGHDLGAAPRRSSLA